MKKQKLHFDKEEAKRFLSSLDHQASEYTFQTFDDNADRRRSHLNQVLNGSIDTVWPKLVYLNQQGSGVFVTVNETDLKGRKKENIIRVRAVWFEDDSGDHLSPPSEPSFSVESSPGKYHHYFLLSEATPEEFHELESGMVALGSDPNAKDISRVLRLPGFYHQKVNSKKGLAGTPFMVRMIKDCEYD